MFCQKCGTQLEEQHSFCPTCGTPCEGGKPITGGYQSNETVRTINCCGGSRGGLAFWKVFSIIVGVPFTFIGLIFLFIGLASQSTDVIVGLVFLAGSCLFLIFIPYVVSKCMERICYVRNSEITGITRGSTNLQSISYTVAYRDIISVEKRKAGGELRLITQKGQVRIRALSGGELDWLYQFLLLRISQN